uniref:Ig-like domain-containing protein n=1 Tax=Haemonchus contortus TaxID=6289 RepID=A0A6F7P566_HAECO|nr:Immunoglobulin I-set domain containing protein [Haemonchus contortus]
MLWLLAILGLTQGFSIESHLTTCAMLLEPPQLQFEQPLRDVEVQYGQSVTLSCSVFGAPQAAIKWLHRGRIVATYSAPSVETAVHTTRIASGLIESKLFVPCVNRHSLGEYACEATSPCGEVISSTAVVGLSNSIKGKSSCNLTRTAIPPTIAVSTVSRLELSGTPVQLMCRASGIPQPKVTWKRINDDDELEDINGESTMVLSNGDLLVVADPLVATESYRCIAKNPSGTASADSTVVFVDES